jgi:hypothetical protein
VIGDGKKEISHDWGLKPQKWGVHDFARKYKWLSLQLTEISDVFLEILLTLPLSTLAVFQGSDEPCRVITKLWTIVTVTPNVGKPMSQIDGDDH